MLTLTDPASRRDTAAADLARRAGLSRVQSPALGLAFGRDRRGEWSAWMRSAAKAWLEIASTSGICVALQRMRRFRVLRPAEGLLGANASWRVWRTPLDPSKAQHRQNAVFVAFVNSAPIVSTDCVILAVIAAPFLPQTPVPDLSGAVAQVSGEFFVLTRYCRASRCRGTFAKLSKDRGTEGRALLR